MDMKVTGSSFALSDRKGTARKKVFTPDGKLMMLMEGSFKSITPQTFQLLSSALLAKAEHQPSSNPSR
jgi:hypothetical protein